MIGIYKITNPNGKIYVGQSRDIEKRIKSYKALWGCKKQILLHRSILKYGVENHKFEIIIECHEHELNKLERHYIMLFNCFDNINGLNLRSGGSVSTHSKETLIRMSNSQKGRIVSKETRVKLSNNNKGRKRPDSDKLKISLSMKGKLKTKEHLENLLKGIRKSDKHRNALKELHESKKKKVLNKEDGAIYNSVIEAFVNTKYSKSYFASMLNASRPNKTTYIYIE